MDDAISFHLEEPDLSYRLTAEDRARVLPPYDPDALERLLQQAIPDIRPLLLEGILPERKENSSPWDHLSRINDPVLQALLEAFWQPFWEDFPIEVLEDRSMDTYPGRLLALERRRNPSSLA